MSTQLHLAASSGVGNELGVLFLVLLAAKLGEELFRNLKQPTIVGEILAGVIIGPAIFGIVHPNHSVELFAELGVIFLLFWVGLETKLSDLREVGKESLAVGFSGVVIPIIAGITLGFALGKTSSSAVFLGASLVATSVGITSAVLIQLKKVDSTAGRTILGAAVVDDILAMVLVAVAASIAEEGSIHLGSALAVLAIAIGFVGFVALGGTRLLRSQPQLLSAPKFATSPLLPAVLLCLGLAALSAKIGLAAIIGAFLAGMIVAETREHHPITDEIAPLYAFFPPFFFAFIGLQLDLHTLAQPDTLLLLSIVTVIAVGTKLLGGWLGARSLGKHNAIFVGLGMIPRGEVGIIVAGIGKTLGVINHQLFAVVVGMSIITTLIVPPLLRRYADFIQ